MTSGGTHPKSNDIQAAGSGVLHWQCDQIQKSLDDQLTYVESEALNAIAWYWDKKKWKARLSRWIRLWALILTACAGLLPIVSYIARDANWVTASAATASGLWASALVGVAAALIGIDRAFGFSTGWARYVLAASEIRKRLEEFRMDWIALTAVSGSTPARTRSARWSRRQRTFASPSRASWRRKPRTG
ncbi:MAG TPA: SLATT domain-containing protein [Burkholderiaceae bacterium]|nr:SLATT domain-containing protein [Burkholderiaceae bacterium]